MMALDTLRPNYALDFTWDVRNHVPPHQDRDGRIPDPAVDDNMDITTQQVYNRINMMTFLLEDIPFDVFLDAPIVSWIDHSIYKVTHQGRWPGRVAPPANPAPQRPYIRASPRPDHGTYPDFPNNAALGQTDSDLRRKIHRTLTDVRAFALRAADQPIPPNLPHPPVKMRSLWDTDVDAVGNDSRVLDIFNQFKADWVTNGGVHSHRLCLPFIALQDASTPVPHHAMDAFIELMRGVTHRDVFTRSVRFFPRIKRGVDLGKAYGIFDGIQDLTLSRQDKVIKGSGGPNNRKCDPGLATCITQTDSFCTADSNGLCTSA